MKTILFIICVLTSIMISAQMKTNDSTEKNTKQVGGISAEETNFWNVIHNRRSVRKFKPDQIPENAILKIIDAARTAPTSGNQQPWKFLIIKDPNTINRIKETCINNAIVNYNNQNNSKDKDEQVIKNIKNRYEDYCSAPVFIVVLTDNNSQYPSYNHWDGPLAAGYLMLAARSLGYGTVFITDVISEEVTKEVLNIPDNYTRVCITPLGIPYEWPDGPSKKKLNDFIIREKF
ncbi:MAG: nitroreductase family protein [bacterium]